VHIKFFQTRREKKSMMSQITPKWQALAVLLSHIDQVILVGAAALILLNNIPKIFLKIVEVISIKDLQQVGEEHEKEKIL
jgi:hypothetical protein